MRYHMGSPSARSNAAETVTRRHVLWGASGVAATAVAARNGTAGVVAASQEQRSAWSQQRFDAGNSAYDPHLSPPKGDVEVVAADETPVGPKADYLAVDGTAYVHTSNGEIGAVDGRRGELEWLVEVTDDLITPEFIEGDLLVARSNDGAIYVIDRHEGEVIHERDVGPGIGLGYDGNGTWYAPRFDWTIVASEGGSGELLWETPIGGIGLRPAVTDRRVYVATIHDTTPEELNLEQPAEMSAEGRLYALDRATGEIEWEVGREYCGVTAPVVRDDRVYWAGADGVLVAYDATDGTEQWTFAPDGGREFHTPPAVTEDRLVIGNDDGNLYAVDPHSGEPIGDFSSGGRIRGSPVVVGDLVIFGTDDHAVRAVEIGTGEQPWEFETAGPVRALAAADDRVYVGTRAGGYVLGPRSTDGTDGGGTRDSASVTGDDASDSDQSEQHRGFLTNDPDSSLSFLDDPVALTWAGIVVSIVGIVVQLFGRQS